ncbi:MAG TPA: RDD family protein, partial [Tepidisphaeraceae bacterium]|nr:RDD family protein [Tepidisphaeraceae bacterium]
RRWTPLALSIPMTAEGSFKVLSFAPRPWLWASPGATGWGDLYYGDDFSRKIVLAGQGNAGAVKARVVTVAGSHIKMMLLNGDGKLLEQDFNSQVQDPDFGHPVGEVAPVMSPTPETPELQPWLLISISMVIVALAASVSYRRRRLPQLAAAGARVDEKEPWAQGPPSAPAKLRLAANFLRLAAGAIDAAPILLWAAILCDPSANGGTMADLSDPQVAIPGVIALAGYLLHTTLAELICGASLGKMLFGMRVVTLEGKPPAPGQIIVRNGLRILDLFIVPLILMLFSPLRQRVGDMAANTTVIEPDAPPVSPDQQDGET